MRNTLYDVALLMDRNFDAAIARHYPGKTRWQLTAEQHRTPDILDAYYLKIEADREWLTYLRSGWGD